MGFLDRLRASRHPLVQATRDPDRRRFARAFLDGDILVLSLPAGLALNPAELDEAKLLALVEAGARDMAERSEFSPFLYVGEGREYVPIFTSHALAEQFVKAYVVEANVIVPFQVLQVRGADLVAAVRDGPAVVLNDMSRQRYEFSAADVEAITREVEFRGTAT